MEIEVSKKVREAIKAKLLELGCHVDDELPDYIMILIANRRSNQEMESDLSLFLTENTKKFVGWLSHVLKKLEKVTAFENPAKKDSPPAPPAPIPAADTPSKKKDKGSSSSRSSSKGKKDEDNKEEGEKEKSTKKDGKITIKRKEFPPRHVSRSRSPVRKLTSKIGSVINRRSPSTSEDDIKGVGRSVSTVHSVVKVTERPKRDLKLNSKILLRALSDAQQSIIQTEQHAVRVISPPKHSTESRKRPSDEGKRDGTFGVVAKRRFSDFPEVDTADFYEPTDSTTRRKSVKERLGVKRAIRRPVKERLGIINHDCMDDVNTLDYYENAKFSPANDYKILINVNDGADSLNGKMRNVLLAGNESKRISIQVNNSEEDDTSEASSLSPPMSVENSSKDIKQKEAASDGDFEIDVYEGDKLPEVPDESQDLTVQDFQENEDVVMEEEAENQNQNVPPRPWTQESSQTSDETNFSITINKVLPETMKNIMPDLRSRLGKPKPVFSTAPSANNLGASIKCKFWPQCQFKDNCAFEHPKCKFSPCKNIGCVYKHDKVESVAPVKIFCKFYPRCSSMNCKFHHPSPCRFGIGCTDARCENYHPGVTTGEHKLKAKGGTVLPKGNQLKWVKQ